MIISMLKTLFNIVEARFLKKALNLHVDVDVQ